MHEIILKLFPKMVGGSEANYMIGEMVTLKTGSGATILELFLELTTLATRADYAAVNRNESIIIPAEATSRQMPDGEVMIPGTS
jgi:hypothetical protein